MNTPTPTPTSTRSSAGAPRSVRLLATRDHAAVIAGALAVLTLAACGESSSSEARSVSEEPRLDPVLAMSTPEPDVATTGGTIVPTNVSYADAESAFTERRYGDATAMFEAYTARKPENVWGHYMFGLSAWKSGEPARAETAFVRAIEIDSTHVKSFVNLSRVLLDLDRPKDALPPIERAIVLDGENADGYRVLGRVLTELGSPEEAVIAYRQAIVRDSVDAWSMNNLGFVLIQQGRHEEALQPLARAVELREIAVFHNNLGIALERSGQIILARQAFEKALAIDSNYVKARTSLTRVAGLTQKPEVSAVDLSELSRRFVEELTRWREDVQSPHEEPEHDC